MASRITGNPPTLSLGETRAPASSRGEGFWQRPERAASPPRAIKDLTKTFEEFCKLFALESMPKGLAVKFTTLSPSSSDIEIAYTITGKNPDPYALFKLLFELSNLENEVKERLLNSEAPALTQSLLNGSSCPTCEILIKLEPYLDHLSDFKPFVRKSLRWETHLQIFEMLSRTKQLPEFLLFANEALLNADPQTREEEELYLKFFRHFTPLSQKQWSKYPQWFQTLGKEKEAPFDRVKFYLHVDATTYQQEAFGLAHPQDCIEVYLTILDHFSFFDGGKIAQPLFVPVPQMTDFYHIKNVLEGRLALFVDNLDENLVTFVKRVSEGISNPSYFRKCVRCFSEFSQEQREECALLYTQVALQNDTPYDKIDCLIQIANLENRDEAVSRTASLLIDSDYSEMRAFLFRQNLHPSQGDKLKPLFFASADYQEVFTYRLSLIKLFSDQEIDTGFITDLAKALETNHHPRSRLEFIQEALKFTKEEREIFREVVPLFLHHHLPEQKLDIARLFFKIPKEKREEIYPLVIRLQDPTIIPTQTLIRYLLEGNVCSYLKLLLWKKIPEYQEKLVVRREEKYLFQLDKLKRRNLVVVYEGEDGQDAKGLTRDFLQNCAYEMEERFASILQKNADGTYEIKGVNQPTETQLTDAKLFAKLFFLMFVHDVPSPKGVIFSSTFYEMLAFFSAFASLEQITIKDYMKLYNAEDEESFKELLDLESEEALQEELKRKSLIFQVAHFFSFSGSVKLHPEIQNSFMPKDLRATLLEKVEFSGERDLELLQQHVTRWIEEVDEERLKRLLKATTGIEALPSGKKLHIWACHIPLHEAAWLRSRTCSCLLEIPLIERDRIYKDGWGKEYNFEEYQEWKEWFERILPYLNDGFGLA